MNNRLQLYNYVCEYNVQSRSGLTDYRKNTNQNSECVAYNYTNNKVLTLTTTLFSFKPQTQNEKKSNAITHSKLQHQQMNIKLKFKPSRKGPL